ncbi:MAG: acetate--CoA ligase [Proteobacteria bacterium]|nr:acetate--CoA ligase [Pseudomonadota bacterium]
MSSLNSINSVLKESRRFKPSNQFVKTAFINSAKKYLELWKKSIKSPDSFWKKQANESLVWAKPFSKTLEWKLPHAKWFVGGKINVAYNCIDRHVEAGLGNKAAIIWEGEDGTRRILTYNELLNEVSQCANALMELGVSSGDRVSIYMPLIPEAVVSMLACARIGAMHSVIFGGFSSDALADRNNDAQSKLVITADGGFRKGSFLSLKDNVDEALKKSSSVQKVLVFKRSDRACKMKDGRDYWWHDIVYRQSIHSKCKPFDSEHPLFLLYTSGSTGKPKGIVHTSAGYLLGATISFKYIFDIKVSDTFWCTADVGWITGHTYVTYGPLSNGASIVMYEGAPNFPDWGRFWSIIERYKVSIFYTAPTAIRACIKAGDDWPKKYDLSSLRILGTVGEPINPEAWLWYHEVIGNKKCPIVDTWWQTETGSAMITPLPGAIVTTPGTATVPFFGIEPEIVDKAGKPVKKGHGGFLVIKKPWPSMLRTIWGDDERYVHQYWSQIPGCYFTGDGARQDKHGNYWILGRIDDVLNVSGHRLSTMEIESTLVSHHAVAEAAVVGKPDDIKGEAIVCFVSLKSGFKASEELKLELQTHVAKQIGALARPDQIRLSDSLPKTRSGKIMRRLLRDIAAGKVSTQDTSTLEDFAVLAALRQDDDI